MKRPATPIGRFQRRWMIGAGFYWMVWGSAQLIWPDTAGRTTATILAAVQIILGFTALALAYLSPVRKDPPQD